MKLAVTGKGGVGKTTLSSLLARVFAAEGRTVLAIDANPDANLAAAVGVSSAEVAKLTPIAELSDFIEERTGAKPGMMGGQFRLNPRVDDIPERFAVVKHGVRLLVLGTVKKGGGGCICPESAVLRSLMAHLMLGRKDVVILDMDAGMEHIGRATAQGVDAFIVVVEPGQRSIQTAKAIKHLANDIGIRRCFVVGSKTHDEAERQFIISSLPDFEVLGFMNFDPQIGEADHRGESVYDTAPGAAEEAKKIKERLESVLGNKKS